MPDPMTAVGGATLVTGFMGADAAGDAAKAQERAGQAGIAEQRAARESFERRTDPFRQTGQAAALPILELLGITPPPELLPQTQQVSALQSQLDAVNSQLSATPTPPPISPNPKRDRGIDFQNARRIADWRASQPDQSALMAQRDQLTQQIAQAQAAPAAVPATPTAQTGQQQSLLAQVNPLVDFMRQQGFEDIQESAAARGRLGAGGTLRDLTEFNTNLAATVVPQLQQQRFNQLFNLLGLGANAAAGQGTAGLQTATNIGNLMGNIGQAQAQGAIGQANAFGGMIGGLSGIYGAQQGGLFNRPMTPNFNTGTRIDPATGAMSSPVLGGF